MGCLDYDKVMDHMCMCSNYIIVSGSTIYRTWSMTIYYIRKIPSLIQHQWVLLLSSCFILRKKNMTRGALSHGVHQILARSGVLWDRHLDTNLLKQESLGRSYPQFLQGIWQVVIYAMYLCWCEGGLATWERQRCLSCCPPLKVIRNKGRFRKFLREGPKCYAG